ncbi:hypothetical protein PHET_03852 [Paragonimus heterotremus]|uniref:Uncharacterized protein n=1 Tax=Paragonimus heterotremus TaxID=100268 RepID=A0A8J4SZP7_9TREM|nr:hypothetical protein PHET_03852 [Paragonimus heterotremus]
MKWHAQSLHHWADAGMRSTQLVFNFECPEADRQTHGNICSFMIVIYARGLYLVRLASNCQPPFVEKTTDQAKKVTSPPDNFVDLSSFLKLAGIKINVGDTMLIIIGGRREHSTTAMTKKLIHFEHERILFAKRIHHGNLLWSPMSPKI